MTSYINGYTRTDTNFTVSTWNTIQLYFYITKPGIYNLSMKAGLTSGTSNTAILLTGLIITPSLSPSIPIYYNNQIANGSFLYPSVSSLTTNSQVVNYYNSVNTTNSSNGSIFHNILL
jgi:hypothetical protein